MRVDRRRWGRFRGLVALLLMVVSGCGGRSSRLRGSDEQFYYGQLKLEQDETLEAIEAFEQLRAAYPGSRYLDAAIFGTGRANFERDDYLVAATHFERLANDFPNSDYRAAARFWLARCYDEVALPARLDQKYTILAIDHYSLYLVEFGNAPHRDQAEARMQVLRTRMAEKDVLTGEFYNRRRKHEAALLFLDGVLDRYADTEISDRARLARAESLLGLGRDPEARDLLDNLSASARDEEIRKRAADRLGSMVVSGDSG